MTNPFGKLPKVKRKKRDPYPKPKKAGRYLTTSDIYPTELEWDGQDWYAAGGDKCLRPKDIYDAWGPIPGTERMTIQEQNDQHREWTLLDAFSDPAHLVKQLLDDEDHTEDDIIGTLKRLQKEGKLRITVHIHDDQSNSVKRWDTAKL